MTSALPPRARDAVAARHERGARFVVRPAAEPRPPRHETLFVVRADGRLEPVTEARGAAPAEGDTLVLLGPVPQGSPDDPAGARAPG